MLDIAPWLWLLLLAAAFTAGWLDAIGGGGGLIQLPVLLLLMPAELTATALGTNKLSSIIGTSAAAATYAKQVPPPTGTVRPAMVAAFIGSAAGSTVATALDPALFRPIIFGMLVAVWLVTWRNPASRVRSVADHETPMHGLFQPIALGLSIGFYDGAIGPGTGAFLLLALVHLFGLSFLRSSATAKFINLATNAASLIVFGITGNIMWITGLLMGSANLLGGITGARLAIKRGSGFVRQVLLLAVALLIARLGVSMWG